MIINTSGGGGTGGGIPSFTYTGDYRLIDDGDKNWRIKFLTSGTLTFQSIGNAKGGIDVFCVGGGGNGGYSAATSFGAAGGGGGYTTTVKGISVAEETPYEITIGAGGTAGSSAVNGGDTSAFNVVAGGGKGVGPVYDKQPGGDGGSGGGSSARWEVGAAGGSDGENGVNQYSANGGGWQAYGGAGQGTTTREFGEETGDLYAGGGGGGGGGDNSGIAGGAGGDGGGGAGSAYDGGNGVNGSANTGGGGGGNGGGWSGTGYGGSGGSGIVVIRNARRS